MPVSVSKTPITKNTVSPSDGNSDHVRGSHPLINNFRNELTN